MFKSIKKSIGTLFLESAKRKSDRNNENINFEKRFIFPLSLAGAIISVIGIVINFTLGFNTGLLIIPIITTVIYSALFYCAKYTTVNLNILKWLLFAVTLVVINALWYYNFGSNSPAIYLFVLLYSFMIFMWQGRQLLFVSLLLLINLLILFYLDTHYPDLTGNYPNRSSKIIDIYTALYYYGLIIFLLMYTAKKSFTSAYESIVKTNKLKSSFLANMSHEIKTPLNAIMGFSELLSSTENISPEERERYMQIINDSNETLLRLIKDILDISLIESEQLELNEEVTNLNEFMVSLKETFELILLENKNNLLVIETELPQENYHILIDAVRLRQVFTNLINNALKFTEEGSITIGYKPEKDHLLFFVKDTGIGIAAEKQKVIFKRFYQENKTDKLNKGVGIGLYVSQKIVGLFHGELKVRSTEGLGSMFYFRIPKSTVIKIEKELPKKFSPIHSIRQDTNAGISNRKLKIMLVEDHAYSLILLTKMLQPLNTEIIQAMDGTSAIELFKANRDVDLIFLDLNLPEKNGYEVIKEIRKLDKHVPVIAETAYALDKDKNKIYSSGFNGFLPKPLDRELVLEVIKAMGLI